MIQLPWEELTLIHPNTHKQWHIEIDGTIIRSCLNHGKVIEKNEKYTADKAVQKVMEKLRKGFVYCHLNAPFSKPILHTFLGKNYTGFLPIAARDDREDFYVLRVVGQFEDEILFRYKEDGTLLSKISLGADRMTFYAILNADGTLYFDKGSSTEHHVVEHYDPENHVFLPINEQDKIQCSEREQRNKMHKTKELTAKCIRDMGVYYIQINDLDQNQLLVIPDEFIVRNANVAFTRNCLLVHTDYGVLSIYNISK